jgi:putative transposase
VRRDGIRFQGLRYSHATLAAYVGDAVTIRYDPRDLSEIRVFHHEQFLYRAVSEAHAGEVVTLKDIQAARRRSIGTSPNLRRRYASTATLACAMAPLASAKPCPRAAMRIGSWQAR